ncbi:Nuclear transcription factor Y subunit B-4 [Linum perenne]
MQECVCEFISFITSETLSGDDVYWAMGSLGFDDYAAPLRQFLHCYKEVEGDQVASQGISRGEEGGGGNFDDSGPLRQPYEHKNQGGGRSSC